MATEMVLNEQAEMAKGESARMSSFIGAIAIADLVKSTLGPKGMDKILQSMAGQGGHQEGQIQITNDGATILRSVHVDNAAAKVLVDISKTQDEEIGDGTTSVAVLCGEMLREAEKLIEARIHPQTIVNGWRLACQEARRALEASALDSGADEAAFRKELMQIAMTTLSSKLVYHEKEYFAGLAVDAVLRLKGSGNLDHIHVLKKPGGSMRDSYLADGFILDKKIGVGQPRRIENAKILLANTSMDADKIKIYGSRVRVDSLGKVAEIEDAERDKMRAKCEKIINHGVNVFINRQLIYNFPEEIFTSGGLMSIEHADFEGIERLAMVTGGEIASTFDHPELTMLGECKLIEEIMIGEDRLISFSGCKSNAACTLVLRGASAHVLEEVDVFSCLPLPSTPSLPRAVVAQAERSMHDALCVLSRTVADTRTICGGGCTEILMAQAVDAQVPNTPGKKALAMEAFARALRQLPRIVADNGGYDSSELVTQLRAAHAAGQSTAGLDMYNGTIADMKELGVRESFKSKLQVLTSASEAAEMILRVDDIIKCAPRQREGQ